MKEHQIEKAFEFNQLQDIDLTPGLTIEANNGSVPNTIVDAFINNFSFTASREENIVYNFGLTGRLFQPGLNPEGGASPFANNARTTSGTTGAYGDGGFASIQDGQVPFAGYNACIGYTTSNWNGRISTSNWSFNDN